MRARDHTGALGSGNGVAPSVAMTAAWILAALASIGVSVAAWREPMWTDAPDLPTPLPRPTSAVERATVEAGVAALQRQVEALRARLGRAPSADELQDAMGGALPDNPVVPGPPSVLMACPPVGDSADWLWCPETGALGGGGLTPG